MNEKICSLFDTMYRAKNLVVCYATGRLLGRSYLQDFCVTHSNLGHTACPLLLNSEEAQKHYMRRMEEPNEEDTD